MNIAQIKEQYTCLDLLGEPAKKIPTCYLFHAPWRTDTKPSLSVTLNGKGWHDLATGEHGNVIDLAMKLTGHTDLRSVCAWFASNLFSFPSSRSSFDWGKEKERAFATFGIEELHSPGLFAYLHSRGISPSIARQLCQEAHYSFRDGEVAELYAIAFANDKGGYELRNLRFKGSKAPKGITYRLCNENAPTVVFEGFMDCLSFATLTQGVKHNYLVINSVSLVDAAIAQLNSLHQSKIFLALDNDAAGDAATAKMLAALPNAIDIRSRFSPYKDVNDYLVARESNE